MAILTPPKDETFAFYHAYGQAMAGWANLEYEMANLFVALTGMRRALGHEIFFSARSFLGRADMLAVCIHRVRDVPPAKQFLDDALAKARTWQSVRNTLAHEMHASVIKQGRSGVFLAISPMRGGYIDRNGLEAAAENFFTLAQIFRFCPGKKRAVREPELCAEALARLPSDALQGVGAQKMVEPFLARIQAHDG